jgi:signal transduction histidine kinase
MMETILTTALAAGGFFLVQFAREFLDLARLTPRMDIAARAMRILMGALFISLTLPWSNHTLLLHITVGAASLTHLVLFIAAVSAWRAGSYYARYFVLSFGVLLGGVLPTATIWLLAIPLGVSALAMRMGSAMEMLLLSLALSDRFARLQRDSLASQLAEEKARLELLRYQLNPHFLFNALNSIYGLVYPHSRAAGELVRRLADFCRGTFAQRGNQWRSLGEELDMLRNYLDIEQARWREQLVVEISAAPEVADAKLPAFLLLPLVENAIKHGGATSPDVLTVRIAAREVFPDAFEIEIANTGRWQSADEPRQSPSHGIGMDNVRARLERNYPGVHRLDIASRDGWVSVVLRLPRSRAEP